MTPAAFARTMQFCAGPQSHTFYACTEHRAQLGAAWFVNELFYTLPQWPVLDVSEDDEIPCDVCRGEDGP